MAKKLRQTQPQSEFDALTECQHRAAVLIASGASYRVVSDRLGVNQCTLSDWNRKPEFRAKVNELLKDAQDSVSRRLVSAASVALNALLEIASSPDASNRDRISAASRILDLVSPQPAKPGPASAEEIEQQEQEEALWSGLTKGLI